ncbi:erythroblast macrophage protein emp, putative [Eimeria maxima]|uniref:Erythroblast macrophage protein emp, putative n=1 Tax=Eimeria maxima TaxID=5804 RepID=U6MAE1_EIMMA|nr:erythroblast macrophage protein emp, putative [Eimeria maxima]CDJ60013.1 erythroblast macrophage protein emp, putative [Eimeria maxima]
MTPEPLLAPLVFAGLCAVNCPACIPELSEVIKTLPMPHRVRSHIICCVTNEPMDEDNPPMASPEGHLISRKGLELLTEKSKTGLISSPYSRNKYPPSTFTRVYLT